MIHKIHPLDELHGAMMSKFSLVPLEKIRLGAFAALAIAVSIFATNPANAAGGSWGSSLGGFGSGGGSWGAGGLLGGQTPVRNLLGRLASRPLLPGGGGSVGSGLGGGSLGSRLGGGSVGSGLGGGGSIGGGSFGGGVLGGGSRGGLLGTGLFNGRLLGGASRGGLLGGRGLASSGSGSTGSWSGGLASSGGSTGSWSGSTLVAGGGSSGSYVATAPLATPVYSTPVLAAPAPVLATPLLAAPLETSYTVPMIGSYSSEESYPIGDYGFEPGYPIQSTIPYGVMGETIGGIPMDSEFSGSNFVDDLIPLGSSFPLGGVPLGGVPIESQMGSSINGGLIQDGGSIDSMLEGNDGGYIPMEGGSTVPTPAQPREYYEGQGNAPGDPNVNPGPAEDNQTRTRKPNAYQLASNKRIKPTVLSLVLPSEAKVYINGQLTKTTGTRRSYKSRKLVEDRDYKYQVEAVLVRNGKKIVRTKLVNLRPGHDQTVSINFEEPVTTLALSVPENAKVKLCGNETSIQGSLRYFATKRLEEGEVWKDYKVEVQYESNGETKTEERVVTLTAGEVFRLAIGVDEAQDQVAAK